MVVDFDGSRYRAASAHQQEWGARLIDELTLTGNEDILDIGCGDGSLTASLAEAVPDGSVVGIDSSAGMIRTASRLTRPNLSFRLVDVCESEYSDEFDVVFTNATLHWIKDHQRLLTVLHRALKEGGVLRANFAGHGNCETLSGVVRSLMESEDFRGEFDDFDWPWYMPTVNAYSELMEASRFRSTNVWGETADRLFPNTDAMLMWIDNPAIVPFKQHLQGPIAEQFQQAVNERMIVATARPDGRCFEMFRRINILARK